jgi:hypothetical protein
MSPIIKNSRLLSTYVDYVPSTPDSGRSGIFRFFLVASTYKQYRADVRDRGPGTFQSTVLLLYSSSSIP